MDVFVKYFRRLVQQNAATIYQRSTETNASYPVLVSEMQKLLTDPEQPTKVAESIDTNEGDLFRDFDLSGFMNHFELDPVAKTALALACRAANKTDIRTKGQSTLVFEIMHTDAGQLMPSYRTPAVNF
jgi:CCR4-NOT transcription complex subunit 1